LVIGKTSVLSVAATFSLMRFVPDAGLWQVSNKGGKKEEKCRQVKSHPAAVRHGFLEMSKNVLAVGILLKLTRSENKNERERLNSYLFLFGKDICSNCLTLLTLRNVDDALRIL
jgi:hypothetical protein